MKIVGKCASHMVHLAVSVSVNCASAMLCPYVRSEFGHISECYWLLILAVAMYRCGFVSVMLLQLSLHVTVIIPQSVAFAPGRNTFLYYIEYCDLTRLGCDGAGREQIYTVCGIRIRLAGKCFGLCETLYNCYADRT